MKVSARVDVNPAPIDLLELEVLRGRGASWNIYYIPISFILIQRLVTPALLVSVRVGVAKLRPVPFPFPSLPVRACVFPPFFVRVALFPSSSPYVPWVVFTSSVAHCVRS